MPISHPHRRTAFTLIEALVATALLVATMAVVSQVFSLASNASNRTLAHAEVIEAAQNFEQSVRESLASLKPGFLLIECPEPIHAQFTGRDIPTQEPPRGGFGPSFRHDRLVFIASGGPTRFESATDLNVPAPTNALNNATTGTGRMFSAADALVFFGPSQPDGRILARQGGAGLDTTLTGKDWIMARRTILLGGPNAAVQMRSYYDATGANAPGINVPFLYPLPGASFNATTGTFGIRQATLDVVTDTADSLLQRISALGTSPTTAEGLWDLSVCPSIVSATVSSDSPTYYRRAAFSLQPRIADLRIDWADGSVIDPVDGRAMPFDPYQPVDGGLQWFGAPWDSSESYLYTAAYRGITLPSRNQIQSGDVCPKWRWLNTFAGAANNVVPQDTAYYGVAFNTPGSPERESISNVSGNFTTYRAAWFPHTWHLRPRSLRFTFRVYDSQDRLTNVETLLASPPPLSNGSPVPLVTHQIQRYGLTFSFVVNVP